MLTIIGTVLNWLAAGILFPLLLMPLALLLAHLLTKKNNIANTSSSLLWGTLTIVTAMIGTGFVWLTPGQTLPPFSLQLGVWIVGVVILMIMVIASGGLANWTRHLATLAQTISRFAGQGVMWLIMGMALVQFCVVILRYVFGLNFIWMQESITYMHGSVFLLAAGYALLTNDHVRVDLFYREASEKRKALIDFLGTYLFLFPVCLLILWAAGPYVYASWEATEGSNEASGLQLLFLLKSLIPAFAVLLLLAGFSIASKAVSTLIGTSVHGEAQ